MSIKWNEVLRDHTGKAIPDTMAEKDKDGKSLDLTLRAAAVHALFFNFNDEKMTGQKSFEKASLAMRIHENEQPVVKAEEIAMIKEIVGKLYGSIVVYRAWILLDDAEAQVAELKKG